MKKENNNIDLNVNLDLTLNEKNNSKKFSNRKASVSMYVLVATLSLIAFLGVINATLVSKKNSEEEKIKIMNENMETQASAKLTNAFETVEVRYENEAYLLDNEFVLVHFFKVSQANYNTLDMNDKSRITLLINNAINANFSGRSNVLMQNAMRYYSIYDNKIYSFGNFASSDYSETKVFVDPRIADAISNLGTTNRNKCSNIFSIDSTEWDFSLP